MSDTHPYDRPVPDTLDGTMTRSEVLEVLQGLCFRGKRVVTIEIDKHAAEWLHASVRQRDR